MIASAKLLTGFTGLMLLVTGCSMGTSEDPGATAAGVGGSTTDTNGTQTGTPDATGASGGSIGGTGTDVSCGGTTGKACAVGQACKAATDCDSAVCGAAGTCAAPTASDGVKNGDETDVDCGGASAPKCAVDHACNVHADCGSDACSYAKKCVAIKSCTAHHGGDTCGPGEVEAGHESCCTTIPGQKLDKYSVTSGRFRTFVERTNGDLRGYITSSTPSWWDASWTPLLPNTLDSGNSYADFTGVYQELGPIVHGQFGPSNEGCNVDGTGTRTYRLPDDVNARMNDHQQYPQDVLDDKPLNCVTAIMMAAFCAWDGGRFPTRQEWDDAWGKKLYPWGDDPAPAGYPETFASAPDPGYSATPGDGDAQRANFFFNSWTPAVKVANDYSLYIAAPGRFPAGNGPFGHADLAGGIFNFQSLYATGAGPYAQASKSGSWQGHEIPYPKANAQSDGYDTPATNKYWATGGRCARD